MKNLLQFTALLGVMFYGQSAFSQDLCAARADFDWDEYTASAPIDGDTHTDETVGFTYSIAGSGGITNDAVAGNLYTDPFVQSTSWELSQDLVDGTESNTITINFGGDLLYDFCFDLLDVDQDFTGFFNVVANDIVTVDAYTSALAVAPLDLGNAADASYTINNGGTTQYNGTNQFEGIGIEFAFFGADAATVQICFAQPIQRIEITWTNTDADFGEQDLGIGDFDYCSFDFDNDGTRDNLETDSDGDGISNVEEGYTPGDVDADGIPNVYDSDFPGRVDVNGDNADDRYDSDNDQAPDALDLDSDNDGILDAIENLPATGGFPEDTDGDGTDDYLDDDSDDDGVSDLIEGNDIDFNGVADLALAGTDADGDGIDDNLDTVNGLDETGNSTGSAAAVAANLVDDDTTEDYRDTDDDGDGTLTSAEIPDANADGIPDYISACDDGSVLTFNGFADGTTPGPVFTVDGVDITFSFTDPSNVSQEYEIDDQIQSDNYVRVLQTVASNTAFTLLRVKFDKPLEGFCFDLLDIDYGVGNHLDSMAVNIFRDGDVIVLDGSNIINGAYNKLNSNNFIAGTNNSEDDEYLGNVRLCLLQSVDSLVIKYGNAVPIGNQAVGLDDFSWCGIDSDYDEILDFDDPDDNNNGIADITEGGGVDHSLDTDGDKIPDYMDADFAGFTDVNGDGVNDNADLDLDGIPDHVDKDTDNDGIPDAVEANGGLLPANMDEDGAYSPAYSLANDSDNDGRVDDVDDTGGAYTAGTPLANPNTDGDAVNDFRDLDSDGDGIPDLVEAGGTDSDGNGTIDNFADATGDGFNDDFDPDVFGTTLLSGSISKFALDTDGDGFANYIDIDSDDDGITDNVEAQSSTGFVAPAGADGDGDGWDNSYDSDNGGTTPPGTDTNGDSTPDYLDTDSDGDGINDSTEGRDNDSDGVADELASGTDTDGDGLDDAYDTDCAPCGSITGVTAPTQDLDVDTRPDYRDTDDDGDGLISSSEDFNGNANFADDMTQGGPNPDYLQFTDDPDSDGVANASDLDDNNDGIPDTQQSDVTDFDGDGIVDRYDLDIDGDGIPNAYEANDGTLPANMDENGQYPSTYATANDSDGDGLVDDIDDTGGAFTGGTPLPNNDFDGDGLDDFEDADADGDGIPDSIESVGTDTNANGIPDSFTDTDSDGNLDYRDGDSDNDGILDLREGQTTAGYIGAPTATDTDGDGISDDFDADNGGTAIIGNDHDTDGTPDFQDSDSDNDGITDLIEGNDNNADGVADAALAGIDTDGDGIDNSFDPDNGGSAVAVQNTDADAEPDYRDNDDDGDGTPTADENVDINPANGTPDYLESNGNTCGTGRVTVLNQNALAVESSNGIGGGGATAALGVPEYDPGDGTGPLAVLGAGDQLDLDLGYNLDAGTVITIHFTAANIGDEINVTSSSDNVTYGDLFTHASTIAFTAEETFTYTTITDAVRYIRFERNSGTVAVDGLVFDACAFDSDNDGVQDDSDNDSDNDGLTDLQEGNGTDPTADADADGILNFQDSDFAGYADANSDGISDIFDQDLDGVPNHQDLDSDNDGVPDAIEANGGSLPANMSAEGAYLSSYVSANDTDNDGHANDVDTDNGGTALANPDSDNGTGYDDGLPDFLDRDSDNDGITDAAENNGTDTNRDGAIDNFVDTDGDGLHDSVDPDNGGSALSIVNTDGDANPDYLDTDSDGDSAGSPGLGDLFEGHDSNFDGTPSWDDDGDLILDTNEGNIDLDGDGIIDAFDPNQGGIGAALPNADGDGLANFRDDDDDDDGTLTIAEDTDGNGNYFDDFTQGQSGEFANVPDYLYNNVSPLPVELISFKVVLNNNTAELTWITAQEINNDYFEIEHSYDGLTFESIGTVDGNGTVNSVSSYSFSHTNLRSGFNYYRLKQVDFDGQFEYSEIKRISLGAFEDVSISIYPNPSEHHAIIQVNDGVATSVELLTLSGTILKSFRYEEGISNHTFDVTELKSGMYLIRVQGPDVNTIKRLIVK
ncbi:T9SS type A sorting domain-containing protein [Ekhidna sp.]|uniref:T9SS type A sorting domain-containing protein n=1 Tax=Ekhidna sp. TaxID=2608089 RepID=UPI003299BC99